VCVAEGVPEGDRGCLPAVVVETPHTMLPHRESRASPRGYPALAAPRPPSALPAAAAVFQLANRRARLLLRFRRGGDSVTADTQSRFATLTLKEVTVTKRLFCVALFLAAFFIVTVPALAWNGARQDYTTSDGCQVCHQSGQPSAAPKVFNAWAATKHGTDSEAANAAKSIPAGSVCAGCHTANFDPTKSSPVPTATTYAFNTALPTPVATKTTVAWGASPSTVASPQALGNGSFSELDIGCSSCHYGASVPGSLSDTGNDVNDTAHTAPYTDLANAEICGACHSRFSYTVNTYTVNPIPSPTASQTTLIQPQMAIGYPMLGVNYQPLSNFLNVAAPGWQPTPNPSATGTAFGQLQTYWTVDGTPTKWQETGHDGSAAQYPEWNSEKHAAALTNLKKAVGSNRRPHASSATRPTTVSRRTTPSLRAPRRSTASPASPATRHTTPALPRESGATSTTPSSSATRRTRVTCAPSATQSRRSRANRLRLSLLGCRPPARWFVTTRPRS